MLETPGISPYISASHSALCWPLLLVHGQKLFHIFMLALWVAF
jgi:hypothetical protein